MPAPEAHRDLLSFNTTPNWVTHSSSPAGTQSLADIVGSHGLETVIQVDIKCVGGVLSYGSIGGGVLTEADSVWAPLPLLNSLADIEVSISAGVLQVVIWGGIAGS